MPKISVWLANLLRRTLYSQNDIGTSREKPAWYQRYLLGLLPSFHKLIMPVLLSPFFIGNLIAQNLPLSYWSTDHGLSNNWISDIFQDSRGFIWIGTQDGVNRFDGYEFRNFKNDPNNENSLAGNWVRTIAEDQDGHLWFGTYGGGLARFDPFTEKFTRYLFDKNKDSSIPDNEIYKVVCGADRRVWVGTIGGAAWSELGDTIFHLAFTDPVYDLVEDANGLIWIGSSTGLYYGKEHHFDAIPALKGHIIYNICLLGQYEINIFTDQGLKSIKAVNGQWIVSNENLRSNIHPNLHYFPIAFHDSKSQLWASSLMGLSVKKAAKDSWRRLNQFPSKNVHCISEDRGGSLWIGTNEGLFKLPTQKNHFNSNQEFSFLSEIPNIRETLKLGNEVWFAQPEGLFVLQEKESQKVLDVSINSLLLSSDGYIYAGPANYAPTGIFRINPQTRKTVFLPFPNVDNHKNLSRKVWSLEEDLSKNIWVGAQGGLFRLKPATDTYQSFFNYSDDSLSLSDIFIELQLDHKGQLWAGTLLSGLYQIKNPDCQGFDDLEYINFKYQKGVDNSLSNNCVHGIYHSYNREVWIGTETGLNHLDTNGNIRRYLIEDGLKSEKILAVIGDNAGRIWGSTGGHGLFCVDSSGQILHFGKEDGLISNDFLLSSVFKTDDNLLGFGSNFGLHVFHPDSVIQTPSPPAAIYFTDFKYLGSQKTEHQLVQKLDSSITFKKSITIPPGQSTFSLKFSALIFSKNKDVEYAYRIEKLHKEWQDLGTSRELILAMLPPGDYNLQIKTNEHPGFSKSSFTSLKLRIQPTWYQHFLTKIVALLLLALIITWIYRTIIKRKLALAESLRLQELDKVKSRFFTNITHELRTPLTLILGPANHAKTMIDQMDQQELVRQFDIIEENGRLLLDQVNQILDLSKTESGLMKLNLVQADLIIYLKYLLQTFQSIAQSKKVTLHFETDLEELIMDYDKEKMQVIISNLLNNAIKFSKVGSDVFLKVSMNQPKNSNKELHIAIKDSGMGIPKEDIPLIFNRFYQIEAPEMNSAHRGTGIGLALVKELVHLLKGEVNVESIIGKGSIFHLKFPIENKARSYQIEDYSSDKQFNPFLISPVGAVSISREKSDLPIILIIEDNLAVAQYIAGSLNRQYQLKFAENGREGIQKALEIIPDFIISDVMMPQKNGFEVCQTLKTDERTSHIPIILLTAKADTESRMSGLQQGADAYLTKPFNAEELQIRIQQMIRLRQRLQTKYQRLAPAEQKGSLKNTSSDAPNSLEDAFLQKLQTVIEEHLLDPELDVSLLCKKMAMSRTQLHRKLTALTNTSTTHFIRLVRYEKAKELLRQTDSNITEVAYQVGFSDPAYFSRMFKKEVGITPSEYKLRF